MTTAGNSIEARLQHLETHLEQENPILLSTVRSFRSLDRVARKIGLLGTDESYATQIPWWPLISVLGTFSSGKSTFINHYLGYKLQRTGNQAVDDRFSVICYSGEKEAHTLPGVALDADPRFPFYQMSDEIELVAKGEGRRIDAYLQLKTCPSERLKGKILIDSPGFDADAQRTSTLRITDHIIDLSDLVLVLFDARHPEPGAMQDTLDHLVSRTINRPDTGKFLFILNQIDTTAREDNPEEVVAAWQRAMGDRGLTAGRFYTIYNPDFDLPIEDQSLKERFERKRDADLTEIHERMQQVEVERAYRIVGALEKTSRDIEDKAVPALSSAIQSWKKRVIWGDALVLGAIIVAATLSSANTGTASGEGWFSSITELFASSPWLAATGVVVLLVVIAALHFVVRAVTAGWVAKNLKKYAAELAIRGDITKAFLRSARPWRSIFMKNPAGWGRGARKRLHQVTQDADAYVQRLNDSFTAPSGQPNPETPGTKED
ncbi:MAG: dynamin family protein [Gammaproteobacteria bacterium]|nr:dynamin family protein [Gammaproteobacteria bacterium]